MSYHCIKPSGKGCKKLSPLKKRLSTIFFGEAIVSPFLEVVKHETSCL
nr:MAG TPA: hypothetical protein [Caudoviricetes sp.]